MTTTQSDRLLSAYAAWADAQPGEASLAAWEDVERHASTDMAGYVALGTVPLVLALKSRYPDVEYPRADLMAARA